MINFYFAIPTIIASDLSNSDLMSIISNKSLAYNWYLNIPASYSSLGYKSKWWFDFNWTTPTNIVVYKWNKRDLKSWPILKTFSDNLKKAYSWTVLQNQWIYRQILAVDTTNTWQITTTISPLINDSLWLNLITRSTPSSNNTSNVAVVTTQANTCATTPSFTNIWTPTPWTPTSVWQAWVYSATQWNCTYTCLNGYTWNTCAIPPASINTSWYSFSEVIWYISIWININWSIISGYSQSETLWWLCFDSTCWSTVTRDVATWNLSWYALSEVFWWIDMTWVSVTYTWVFSWYGQSEVVWWISFN